MKSKIMLEVLEEQEFVVNWHELPEEANYVVIEYNGDVFWHKDKPVFSKYKVWDTKNLGNIKDCGRVERLNLNVLNPQDTLTKRPQGKFKKIPKHKLCDVFIKSCDHPGYYRVGSIKDIIETTNGYIYNLSFFDNDNKYITEDHLSNLVERGLLTLQGDNKKGEN